MGVLVSVVVPVLADLAAAERLLPRFPADPRIEVIVVDGGHEHALERLVSSSPGSRLIRSRPGRAIQMNAGAAVARGEWLLFLHADSTLPEHWIELFAHVTGDARGGWFRFALEGAPCVTATSLSGASTCSVAAPVTLDPTIC